MNWPQLIYQYSVGGTFFFVTLWLCFRLGAADIKNSSDRKALIYLIAGIAGYFAFHTIWIILATP